MLSNMKISTTLALVSGMASIASAERPGGGLRGLQQMPADAVVCLTAEQCEEKFNSLNWDGHFYANDSFPTKGCFSKNNNGNLYFGTGGSVAEMSETNVPGSRERVWCDVQTDVPTPSPIQKQVEWVVETTAPPVTDTPSKQPTLKPVTDTPTEQPTPRPSNSPSFKPTMQPTTKPTVSIIIFILCVNTSLAII